MHPLLTWFDAHQRDLPWRRTRDPYAIWVSEIMLQQTQVSTVIPFWERWMQRFPTVWALAQADEQEVLAMWQGLGYYRRARMLHAGARYVVAHGMPERAKQWIDLPGVGRYTAGAIASIAQGEVTALVDGNVERVFARVSAAELAGPALTRAAWNWAGAHVDSERPGDWNQALMELGATVCTPVDPDCVRCPLENECVARAAGRTSELPRRPVRRSVVQLEQYCWIPRYDDRFGVRQIPVGQWWQGMWEFPRADSTVELRDLLGDGPVIHQGRLTHTVTHHRIRLNVSLIECTEPGNAVRWVEREELENLPMPAPQRRAVRFLD